MMSSSGVADSSNAIAPSDCGFLGWSIDPTSVSTSHVIASGSLELYRVKAEAGLARLIVMQVVNAGSALTASLLGLYDVDGNLLGETADQGNAWQSVGTKWTALATPVEIPAGLLYVACLAVGTTGPGWGCGAKNGSITAGDAAGAYRFAVAATGQTSLPASLDMSGQGTLNSAVFAGLTT